ncbi:MAG: hypothetical protein RL385_4634 [Pseudomonadota bacterium]|jgi:hypothetical protein
MATNTAQTKPVDSHLSDTAELSPSGWPVVERGLLMAYVERVVVVRIDADITDASLGRFLDEWPRGIDIRTTQSRCAALYDLPAWSGATALMRRRMAELLHSWLGMLSATTKAWALVTQSPLVSGMVQAIHWVQPPPYPHCVTHSAVEGFEFIQQHLPELGVARGLAKYVSLLSVYHRRMH